MQEDISVIVLSEIESKHLTGLRAFGMDMETQSNRAGETQLRNRESRTWGRGSSRKIKTSALQGWQLEFGGVRPSGDSCFMIYPSL